MPGKAVRGLALLFLIAGGLRADIKYMVDYLLPRGGGQGTTVSVEFHGSSLENAKEIVFYEPGVQAAEFVPYAKPADGFKVKFKIARDCRLGEHVLRVRTDRALSDAVTFWVSRWPTTYEFEGKPGENDTISNAKPVSLNTTVEGQIQPGPDADVDVYKVEARQGQRLSVEVEAARLGTLHFGGDIDLAVRILDGSGKVLAKNDDSALYVQDPVVSVMVPADGAYFVEIRQQIYEPPRQAWYRAHIGTFLRPSAIFPAGGQAGTTLQARVIGDPAGVRTEAVVLPAELGNFAYFAGDAAEKPPSPNVLRVSPYGNVIWSGAETAATLPAALNGILEQAGQAQSFRFSARKNEAWRVQVFARTLGAPVDAHFTIRAAVGGRVILEGDDSRLVDLGLPSSRANWHIKEQLDPVAIFKAPADGDYVLAIDDSTGAAGPDHVYRVEIEPVRDTVYTHITAPDGYQMPRLAAMVVPKGNRWTLDVQVAPGLGNNYKGELDLKAEGLPRGVTMIAPRFPKGAVRMPVQFVAAADAEPQAALVRLLAVPVEPGAKLESGSRQAFALGNRSGELPFHFVFLDRYALAVTEPAPFHIELEPPAIPISQSGELLLKVKVLRHEGFKDAVEIQPDWLPAGVQKGATVTIPAGKDIAEFRLQADAKAAPGTYRIAMNASTQGGDAYSGVGRVRVSSPFVELKVAEPYLSIDLRRGAVERGKASEVVGVVKQNRPFEGSATVTLQQLPKGVRMLEPAPQITANDREVVIRIEADGDALAGLYRNLSCEVALTEAGQTVRQRTGSGILRVDAARAASSREGGQ